MISVESFNQLLFLFSAVVLLLISFSNLLQRLWMPLPLPALIFGVIIGPEAGAWLDIPGAQTRNLVLEEAARLTLAVG
jgi:NhaP-type Na+/H+ or K+/H+ antiporter